jgi:hypothetical protein
LFGEQSGALSSGAFTFHHPHFNRFQKDTPALAAPRSSQLNRGFLRREDYYTAGQLATKKCEKPAFLLGEITSSANKRLAIRVAEKTGAGLDNFPCLRDRYVGTY